MGADGDAALAGDREGPRHDLGVAGMEAALVAAEHLEAHHDAALNQWRLEVERRRYEASKAERRYHAVDPENRLVARGLDLAITSWVLDGAAALGFAGSWSNGKAWPAKIGWP